jgi:hypothetical protein
MQMQRMRYVSCANDLICCRIEVRVRGACDRRTDGRIMVVSVSLMQYVCTVVLHGIWGEGEII